MKIINQTKCMKAIKYFQLIVLTCLTLMVKAQTAPSSISISSSCGKLTANWPTASGNVNSYDLTLYKLVSGFPTFVKYVSLSPSTLTYTFPSNANEIAEPGIYYFEIKTVLGGNQSSPVFSSTATVSYNALAPTITNLCSNTFTINWTRLITSGCNTAITYRYYIYKYTNISGTVLSSGFIPVIGTTTNNTYTYNYAEPEGFYKIQVEAISNNGTSTSATGNATYPTNLTFQTPAIPATPINNISFSNITCSSFNINWSAFTGSCVPNLFTYRYSIYNTASNIDNQSIPVFVGTTTSSITSILYSSALSSSNYKVKVEAVNGYTGNTLASSVYPSGTNAIQTLSIPNVSGFTVDNIITTPASNYCTGLSASWLKTDCASDYIIQVFNHYSDPNGILISTHNITGTSASVQTFSLTNGLFPGNSYTLKIRAIKKDNNIEVATSSIVTSSFITMPSKITMPAITSITTCGRSVTITWTPSTDPRADGYLLDLSNSASFTTGNFIALTSQSPPIQNFFVTKTTGTITFDLPSFYPFVQRSIYFRMCAKNSNNTCNSDYTMQGAINLSETPASIDPSPFTCNTPIETVNSVANTFKTYYLTFGSPYQVNFRKDNCVVKCQVKVEMANANGTLFTGTSGSSSWTGPQTTMLTNYLSGFFSDYIKNNGGTLCNYNGIGTTANINASTTSFLLAPEIKYGTQVLSTGYHKITLLYWTGNNNVPEEQSIIVKIFNVFTDFSLQYPNQAGAGSFTNYYFNTASSAYDNGPGFNCLQFNAIINAKSNTPNPSSFLFTNYNINSAFYWGFQNLFDFEYNQSVKIIYSKALTADEFYIDAYNNNQILAQKILTNNELWQLRIGTLNLIDLYNSLGVFGNINYIGIQTGTSSYYNYLNNNTSATKIISFKYTAKPTNVALTYKCTNDVALSWSGNGNAAGTIFLVTIGSSYTSSSNTISNYATSGTFGGLITYNNYPTSINQLQALFNNTTNATYYVQIKTQNGSCISDPSTIFSFPIYTTPIRLNFAYTSLPIGFPLEANLGYDNCIQKCSLEVQNLNDPNDKWIGTEEDIIVFANHYNTLNNNNVPVGQSPIGAPTIHNYINAFRSNGGLNPNPYFYGYDGYNFVSPGNLFKSFKGAGTYRIRLVYKLTTGGYSNLDQTITINSPDFPVTLKTVSGSFVPSNVFEVPFQRGYQTKSIRCYANTKYLSAFINPFSLFSASSIFGVAIDFSNTLTGFPATSTLANNNLSSTDLNSFLTTGIDLNNYAANLGASGAAFIRISYFTNSPMSGTVSAIYNFLSDPNTVLYIRSNEAYETEKLLGFRDIVLESNLNKIYTYDHNNHFYYSGNDILIPDNNSTEVSNTNFFGFSGGTPSSTNFQWDNQTLGFPTRGSDYTFGWDETNLFVSPFSANAMNICDVIDQGNTGNPCNNTTLVNIPAVVYSTNYNSTGNYVSAGSYTIDNLIMDQGLVDNGADNEFIIQQSASTNSYCVNKYGTGWRLPTATEIGKEDDLPVMIFNTNPAYYENSTGNIWTSNLWNTNSSWWEANGSNTNTQISLNNSFYSTNNYVRCVYKAN